jgi:hypothetical protein
MHLARVEHGHGARLEELPRAAQLAAFHAPQDEAESVGVVEVPVEARAQAFCIQRVDAGNRPHRRLPRSVVVRLHAENVVP